MQRIQKLQKLIIQKKLSAVFISKPENVKYLCGYIGTNGQLLVTPKNAMLATDFRYFTSARKQIPKGVKIFDWKKGIKKLFSRFSSIGIEDAHMTHAQFKNLKKTFKKKKFKCASGLVEDMRVIKNAEEIKIMRRGCRIADECLKRLIPKIKVGVSESDLAFELLAISRVLGAEEFSFPPIVAFGKNTADVHHICGPKKLVEGEPVLIDFGIVYKGYATDMTRMFYTGKPTLSEQKMYSTVLAANQAAISAIKVGKKLSAVDKAARDVIKKAGYGKYFGHGTGHGVGLEVHEEPKVSEKSKDIVKPGMVFTIEPGIYRKNTGGVRIEDMVYVNEKGEIEVLTAFSRELQALTL